MRVCRSFMTPPWCNIGRYFRHVNSQRPLDGEYPEFDWETMGLELKCGNRDARI